jgi:hypothetical protein
LGIKIKNRPSIKKKTRKKKERKRETKNENKRKKTPTKKMDTVQVDGIAIPIADLIPANVYILSGLMVACLVGTNLLGVWMTGFRKPAVVISPQL